MRTLNLTLGLLLSVSMASTAMADHQKGHHPCETIKKACEAAGFQKGKHKDGKGLFIDCMGKLAKGESVPGVTVSQDDINACKTKHEAHKAEHEKK